MAYNARKTRLAAVLTAVGLLPVSAIIVAATTDRPLDVGMFLFATAIANLVLCLFLGLICMLLGYGIAIAKREWFEPQPLLGFGARLAFIVFATARLLAHSETGDQPPDPPGPSAE